MESNSDACKLFKGLKMIIKVMICNEDLLLHISVLLRHFLLVSFTRRRLFQPWQEAPQGFIFLSATEKGENISKKWNEKLISLCSILVRHFIFLCFYALYEDVLTSCHSFITHHPENGWVPLSKRPSTSFSDMVFGLESNVNCFFFLWTLFFSPSHGSFHSILLLQPYQNFVF